MIEPIARIRIELEETEPLVWRRVDVPLSSTLMALHDIIQVAMRWTGSHIFEFEVGNRIYGEPYPGWDEPGRRVFKAGGVRLKDLVGRGIDRFRYIYDFGDYWRHDIILEGIREGDEDQDYPAFVDGARRAPPDDVGGISGFEHFLEAIADPGHEDHEQMTTWYGGLFDPEDIDERHIRMILDDFAARRRGPLRSHRTGKRPWH
jgi:hypothetical protein